MARPEGAVFLDLEAGMTPVRAVELLTNAGWRAVLSGNKRIWLWSAAVENAADAACFNLSPWTWTDPASQGALFTAIGALADIPRPVEDIDVTDPTQTGSIRERLRSHSGLAFFSAIEEVCLNRRTSNLRQLLDALVLPEFFRRYPNGRCAFVGVSEEFGNRSGALRALGAQESMSWAWVRQAAPTTGFPMLRAYHRGPSTAFDTLLSAYVSTILPHAQILIVPRLPGHFVFILDKPHDLVGPLYDSWDAIQQVYFRVGASHAGGGRRSLVKTPLSVVDAMKHVERSVRALNACVSRLTAPERYSLAGQRFHTWSMIKQWILMERISVEVGIAATTPNHFLRKILGFAVADKFASVGFHRAEATKRAKLHRIKNLSNNQFKSRLKSFSQGLEAALFSRLLVDSTLTSGFRNALLNAESPVVQALAPTLPLLQQALSESVLQGLYVPASRASAGKVLLRARDRERKVPLMTRATPEQEYVQDFLRQMRNTHHGYGLYQSKFELILSGHTGQFGDEVADVALLLWIAAVHDPELLAGSWIDGQTFRATKMN